MRQIGWVEEGAGESVPRATFYRWYDLYQAGGPETLDDRHTPADVYCGRGQIILLQRERMKRQTIALRRLQHQRRAA